MYSAKRLSKKTKTNERNEHVIIVVNNKSHIYLVGGENLVQLSSVIHRGSLTNTLFHTMKENKIQEITSSTSVREKIR